MQSGLHFQHACATRFSFALLVGRALPAMAEQPPNPPWKRMVTSLGPDWMSASVERLEEARAETLDSARKKQRDTPREDPDEEMFSPSASATAASASSGQRRALPSSASLPPRVSEDMEKFRHMTLTPASFVPQRHLFMCAGRPMVVALFMYSPTHPPFLSLMKLIFVLSLMVLILVLSLLVLILLQSLLWTLASIGVSSQFCKPIFGSVSLLPVLTHTDGVDWLCCQVLVMSHERTNSAEMDSYFGNKFHPARPIYVVGRSYKAEPQCKPEHTLFDNWMDRSHSHDMTPRGQPCIMPACVPHSIVIMFAARILGSHV